MHLAGDCLDLFTSAPFVGAALLSCKVPFDGRLVGRGDHRGRGSLSRASSFYLKRLRGMDWRTFPISKHLQRTCSSASPWSGAPIRNERDYGDFVILCPEYADGKPRFCLLGDTSHLVDYIRKFTGEYRPVKLRIQGECLANAGQDTDRHRPKCAAGRWLRV
jgi:hypothetical protein